MNTILGVQKGLKKIVERCPGHRRIDTRKYLCESTNFVAKFDLEFANLVITPR